MLCYLLAHPLMMSEAMHRQLHWLDVVDRVNYKIASLSTNVSMA